MQNNFPRFGKKYKVIKVLSETNAGKEMKWTPYLIYDPEKNRIIISLDKKQYWVDLYTYLSVWSWPLCRTGIWPDEMKYATPLTEEESEEVEKNCVNYWRGTHAE